MKIRAITSNNFYQGLIYEKKNKDNYPEVYAAPNKIKEASTLRSMPVHYPISFGIQNSSKLRILFGFDLPCIYSGVIMIDPKQLTRWQKGHLFNRSAKDVLSELDKYPDSFVGMEKRFIELIRERSDMHPEMTMKDI